MRDLPASRLTAFILVFILGCLLSSARIIRDSPVPGHLPLDSVAEHSDRRFAALKAALPSQGVVGYIGNSSDPVADYYLAQYALAPVIVDHSPQHPLVIGNFPAGAVSAPPGLRLVTDFGNGVLLFSSEGAQ